MMVWEDICWSAKGSDGLKCSFKQKDGGFVAVNEKNILTDKGSEDIAVFIFVRTR